MFLDQNDKSCLPWIYKHYVWRKRCFVWYTAVHPNMHAKNKALSYTTVMIALNTSSSKSDHVCCHYLCFFKKRKIPTLRIFSNVVCYIVMQYLFLQMQTLYKLTAMRVFVLNIVDSLKFKLYAGALPVSNTHGRHFQAIPLTSRF